LSYGRRLPIYGSTPTTTTEVRDITETHSQTERNYCLQGPRNPLRLLITSLHPDWPARLHIPHEAATRARPSLVDVLRLVSHHVIVDVIPARKKRESEFRIAHTYNGRFDRID